VRIEQIHVDAYGRLQDFDTGSRPLGPLVVVLGPNEAGKSTLFSFLTTALYGFHPASRERNPHLPWGAEEAGGRIAIRLEAEGCVVVERRLRSSPAGRVVRGAITEDIRNQPLSWVEHVPRTVFRQVFAVTLADLAGLDDETWGRIQDRVLGSMGASDLRPAREVADALEKMAGEIWRPNRRGNQRLRDVQEKARALRGKRNDALARDRRIRALVEEREGVDLRLLDVRADRQRDKLVVERMQELMPVKRQLDRVATLRAAGGPRTELLGLPDDLHGEVARRGREGAGLRDKVADMDHEIAELEAIVRRFDDGARRLLDHGDRIARFLVATAGAAGERTRLREAAAHGDALDARVRTAADQVLESEYDERVARAVSALSLDLLGDRVERLARAERTGDGARAGHPAASPRDSFARRWGPVVALLALGAIALAWGVGGGPTTASIVGAALAAVGATLAARRRGGVASPEPLTHRPDRSQELGRDIAEMLRDVPVRPGHLNPPGTPLVSDLANLQRLVHQCREAHLDLSTLEVRVASADRAAQALASELGRPARQTAEELAAELERDVRSAEAVRAAADSAARDRDRRLRDREGLAREAESVADGLRALRRRIEASSERPERATVEVVQRRLEAHTRADRIEEDLERTHPDLPEIRARIAAGEDAGMEWAVDETDLVARKARVEELDELVEALVARSQVLERDVAHLREMETVDAVDSEIATLQETEARLAWERDRKWVLAQLVRDADRKFREEHQPDLIRRASSYLKRLTGGRYDRLLVDEYGDGDLFQLVGPGLPAPVPLDRPISTATLEQAYLSLRLAIVDHLDQGKERLPLFIDEAFVNWDAERRDRGLEVLAEASSTRQVFAFTCHPEMAERLGALGACVLRLRR
jgi:uncharacterized protein YhaN